VKCSACGAELVADARFCHYCGVAVAESPSTTEPTPEAPEIPVAAGTDVSEQPQEQDGSSVAQPSYEPSYEEESLVSEVEEEWQVPEPPPAPQARFCMNCGSRLGQDEAFCTNCGTRAETPVAAANQAPAPAQPVFPAAAQAVPAAPPPVRVRYCLNCGTQLAPGDVFCTNCGTRPDSVGKRGGVAGATPSSAMASTGVNAMATAGLSGQVEYKGVGARFMASLVDFVLYLILMAAMAFQFGSTSAQASFGAGFSFNLQGWSAAVVYLVSFAYMILMEGYLGGTVGKLVLGIRVVDISGGKPGPVRALIRNVLRIVDFLPFCYLLGILMVAFSKKKRRLGDLVAGTYVISSRSVNEMKASGEVAKPANSVVAAVAGVLALAMILSGALFSPQTAGVSSFEASSQVAKAQPTPTPEPAKSSSSGSGPFGISLPSISLPFIGGGDPADVAGEWSGSMTITGAKIDGASGDEQKKLDQEFSLVKGTSIPMEFSFDGKNEDSGTVSLDGGYGGSQEFEYKVSGDKVTFGGKSDEGNFTFEGKVSKKGSSYEIDGTFKAEGPATGISDSKTLKIEGNWKATK
jgi:uncharacterized RDD family membrane protein YckC